MPLDDSYTKVLLHFEGADGATTITDESGKTWTAQGGAQIDTAYYKFQQASGYFNNGATTSDHFTTPAHADFQVGSDDFTVECWFMLATDNTNTMTLTAQSTGTTDQFFTISKNTSKYIVAMVRNNADVQISATTTGVTVTDTTTWHHVAAVKYGTELAVYLDGTKGASTGTISAPAQVSGQLFSVGSSSNGTQSFVGWIDEFRFSKGIARYTANFTPPTIPFGIPSGGENMYFADGFSVY